MKAYTQELLKRNLQFILFLATAVISSVSLVVSIRTNSKNHMPVLIAIDQNGTRIVKEVDDPIFTTEAMSFIQRFVGSIYNFDSISFMKKVGVATSLMSEKLWKEKRSSILDLKTRVEKDEISVSGRITKITKDGNTYYLLIDATEKSRMNVQERLIKVAINLQAVQRNAENPWGMEVDSYEETIIKN